MSNDNEDRGRKDGGDKIHKPKEKIDFTRAPEGSVGQDRVFRNAPGINGPGGSVTRTITTRDHVQDERNRDAPEQGIEPEKDDRPIAPITGDTEVDRRSEEQGHRMMPQEEFDQALEQARAERDADERRALEQIKARSAERGKDHGHER